MKQKFFKSIVSVVLALMMILPVVSVAASAIEVPSNMRIASDIETELAPGLISNQAVAYNESGNRVALFVSTIDLQNHDDLHIIANYKDNQCDTYGMQKVSEQVAVTEAKHAGEDSRIVNAVNATGFNMTTGRPTGIFVMDGVDYTDPPYNPEYPFFAVLKTGETIIDKMGNYDLYKDNVKEAASGFKFLVQDGEVVPGLEIYPTLAPRTTIGLTADNKVVLMVADGRQYPYSVGLDNQQQAEIMQSLGCVTAMEFDGGGSTTYGCRMPGSDHFEVINKPSDGDERAVSGTIMVVSTAKATGTLDKINVTSDYEYASPNSPVTFSASGSDTYGFPVDLPENTEFRLSDNTMGTLEGNVFTAGTKLGDVTLSAYVDDVLYGSKTISIVQPEEIVFDKTVIYATYGKSVPLPISANYNGMKVSINGDDIYTLTGDINAIAEHPEINGYVEGLTYYAPDENCGIRTTPIYAILNLDETGDSLIQAKIELHRESESVFDFSEATVNLGMVAYNREIKNTTLMDSDNNVFQYTVIDPNEQVKVNYVMAIDLGQLELPEYLNPLWEAFGEGLGGNLWYAFLKIANKIEPQSSITIIINYDKNLSVVNTSDLSFNCPLFAIDRENIEIDNDTHTLTIPMMWNDDYVASTLVEHGFIDPVLIDPIGIITGLEFVVDEGVIEDAETLGFISSVSVNYNLTALSSGAYGTVTKREPIPEEYLEDPTYVPPYVYPELVQYAYINPEDSRPGICVYGEYFNYTDSFKINKAPDEGWSGDYYIYRGQMLKGAYLIDGEICYFDKNGVYDPDYVYYGLLTSVDGKDLYYSLENTLKYGWVYENEEYYYFDRNTYKAVDGVQVINGQTYTFEDYILVDGYWETTEEGTCLYWAGQKIWRMLFTVKGKTYYFNNKNLMETGVAFTFISGTVQKYYLYGQDGVWMEDFTGIYEDPNDGKCYYVVDGVSVYGKTYAGLCQVDGDYYYIRSDFSLVKDQYYTITKTRDLLPAGRYFFDKDGKLVPDDEIKNGIYEEDGALYYYVMHSRNAAGVVKIGDDYYYAQEGGLIATGKTAVVNTNNLLTPGVYTFDSTGKMLAKSDETGTFEDAGGNIYYTENGDLKSGWVSDGENYSYYDPASYTAVDGEAEIDGNTYTFENRVLVKGAWVADENGTRYFWAGTPVTDKLLTEDGDTYFLGHDGYMAKGVAKVSTRSWYLFGEDGKWMQSFSGIYDDNGFNYYIENGVSVYGDEPAGLCQVGDDYYYINTDGTLAKDGYALVARTNGLMSYGTYYFDEDGKLVSPEDFKNGIVRDDDGNLYYYVEHKKVAAGWIEIDGDTYYAGEGGLVKTGAAIIDGTVYYFNEDGKLQEGYKYTGLVADEEGTLFYAEQNNLSSGWKEDNGNYYYFDPDTKQAVTGEQVIDGHTYTFADYVLYDGDWEVTENGTILYWAGKQAKSRFINAKGNTYYFDASGYMATGLTYIKVNNVGQIYVFDDDGVWLKDFSGFLTINDFTYFVEEGISVHGTSHAGLVKFEDNYYYINTSGQLIKDQFYGISKTNNLLPSGTYYFDKDGKIDFDVELKNGIYRDEEDGLLYYYVNSKKTYAGLFMIGDDYYYANSNGLIATGVYKVTKTNNLLPADYYMFDEDGKMIQGAELRNGIFRDDDGILYYYQNGLKTYAGLIVVDGDYYYVRTNGALAVTTYNVSKTNGLMSAGTYNFREDGKMILNRNGFVEVDGKMRYYINDDYVKGLAYDEDSGKYYYLSLTDGDLLKGGRMIVPADESNGLFDKTKVFYFDSETGAADAALDFADYSELDAKLEAFEKLDESLYTNYETAQPVYEAVSAWKSANTELDETQQNLVDAKTAEMTDALNALVFKPIDTSAFEQAQQTVPADLSIYTADSVTAMNNAKSAVDTFLAGDVNISHQSQLDNLVRAYTNAIAALAEKNADYTALNAALTAFEAVNGSLYANYNDVKAVYTAAKSWKAANPNLKITSQSLIDAKAAELNDAIATLTLKEADLTALNKAFSDFEALDGSLYSNYNRIKPVYDATKAGFEALPSTDITQQAAIDELADTLNTALRNLAYKTIDTTGYYETMETIPADCSIYTVDSVNAMDDAQDAIETFLEGNVDIRNQSELDALVAEFAQAIADLEVILADYTALNNVLAEFEAIDGTAYSNYDEVLAVYNDVKSWKEANPGKNFKQQAEVNAQTKLLRDAIDSLVVVRFGVKEGSTAVIEGNYIYGLKTNLTAANLRNTFLDFEGVDVTFTKAIEEARYYGTGSTVTVTYKDGHQEVYTIIIFGDVDGNSIIDNDDAFATLSAAADNSLFDANQKKAANVDGVRRISLDDYAIINDAVLGIKDIDQTAVA